VGNCVGILALNFGSGAPRDLPSGNYKITKNKVWANNMQTPPADGHPGFSGLGIALAVDHDVVVRDNTVSNNRSTQASDLPKGGIVVFSTAFLGGADPTNNTVAGNVIHRNTPADIFWEGTDTILVGPPPYPETRWRGSIMWVTIALLAVRDPEAGRPVPPPHRRCSRLGRHHPCSLSHLRSTPRAVRRGSACHRCSIHGPVRAERRSDPPTTGTDGVNLGLRVDPRTENCATAKAWRTGMRIYLADTAADPHSSTLTKFATARALPCQPVTATRARRQCLLSASTTHMSTCPRPRWTWSSCSLPRSAPRSTGPILTPSLEAQSRRDPLTGAANRHSWDEQINRELVRSRRSANPLTVAIIDMDPFKAYNDTNGHLAGDALLKDFVTAICEELRTDDVIARWGGEEFALALPDCELQRAQVTASPLLAVVPSGQTASIGLPRPGPWTPPGRWSSELTGRSTLRRTAAVTRSGPLRPARPSQQRNHGRRDYLSWSLTRSEAGQTTDHEQAKALTSS